MRITLTEDTAILSAMKLSPLEERIHEKSEAPHPWREGDLVQLDPDHPGFRDRAYRERRNAIARIALEYKQGPVPRVDYTAQEGETWRAVWKSLAPLHQKYACAEYRDASDAIRRARASARGRERLAPASDGVHHAAGGGTGRRSHLSRLSLPQRVSRHPVHAPSEPAFLHAGARHRARADRARRDVLRTRLRPVEPRVRQGCRARGRGKPVAGREAVLVHAGVRRLPRKGRPQGVR